MKSEFAFFSILRAPRRAFESPQAGAPTFRGCQDLYKQRRSAALAEWSALAA